MTLAIVLTRSIVYTLANASHDFRTRDASKRKLNELMRLLIPATIVSIGLLAWAITWISSRREDRDRDRIALINSESYLALEEAVNLLARIVEQDDQLPALLSKHRKEAVDIVDSFHQLQLRKGK